MSTPPAMPFYPKYLVAEVSAMTTEEIGAFFLLLMHRWQCGELPEDDERLALVCRMPLSRWLSAKPAVMRLFEKSSWGHVPAELMVGIGAPEARRSAIPAAVKAAVYERDGDTCHYCSGTEGPFELDHKIPWSRGGEHTVENLVVACVKCNRDKGARTPEEWRQ